MLTNIIEQIERVVLHMEPQRSVAFLNVSPQWAIEKMQRARFQRTLRLAAERSTFYRAGKFWAIENFGVEPDIIVFGKALTNGLNPLSGLWAREELISPEVFPPGSTHSTFSSNPLGTVQFLKCFHVEAGKISPQEFYDRARAYKPNVIFGEPSWIVRLSELAGERGTWPMKLLFGGGENISEQARSDVEQIWKAPLYLSYGQTESFGTLGVECKHKEGYHRNDLFFYFETRELDTEGYGELVYTTLARDVMPLIRYRSTDVTALVEEPCPCGLFARRIAKIRARTDEMVVCGMGNVGPWVFAELLRGVNGHGADWQVVVKHDGSRDVIELRLELKNFGHQAEVELAVLANLRERFTDFWKNYEMKLYDFRVVPCEPGSLRDGRKLKLVLDQRQMTARRAR